MKNYILPILLILASTLVYSQSSATYQFISPLPNSTHNLPTTSISIRYGDYLEDIAHNASVQIVVQNTEGHIYNGEMILALDKKTLVWYGDGDFMLGDTIKVRFEPTIRTLTGEVLPYLEFQFTIANTDVHRRKITGAFFNEDSSAMFPEQPLPGPGEDFSFQVTKNINPAPGYLFVGFGSSLYVLDNELTPVLWKKAESTTYDVKLQPNGLITYFDYDEAHFFAVDSSARFARLYDCGNGYWNDAHELQVKENGNYYILGKEHITVDLSDIVEDGDPEATILSMAVQELDAGGNILFQWRTWDHYDLMDTDSMVSLQQSFIDYVHCNAIEEDTDGNILLSTRNLNEITKINRETGEIMWRLGGEKNEFEFINDSRGFNRQHDVRRLANGNISLFDNGHYAEPQYSSYVEYQIDTIAMTATLERRFSADDSIFTRFRGNAQELENGNTFISWGEHLEPGISEIDKDNNTVFEIVFDEYYHKYRSFRYEWKTDRFSLSTESINFDTLEGGASQTKSFWVYNPEGVPLFIKTVIKNTSSFLIQEKGDITVPPKDSLEMHLIFEPRRIGDFDHTLTVQHHLNTSLVGRQIRITGACTSYVEKPTDLRVSAPSSRNVVLQWTDNSDNEDGFNIYRKQGYHENPANLVLIGQAPANATQYTDTTATVDTTTYTYALASMNAFVTSERTPVVHITTPLPVELSAFSAEQKNKHVHIQWRTESEINNNGFEIQRSVSESMSDTLWRTVGYVKGHGTTAKQKTYSFIDSTLSVATSKVLYRLKQVDYDGSFEFSNPVEIAYTYVPEKLTLHQNYPNPFNPSTTISYALPEAGNVQITIYTLSGEKVTTLVNQKKFAGYHEVKWNAEDQPTGVYLYEMRCGEFRSVRKMILMK